MSRENSLSNEECTQISVELSRRGEQNAMAEVPIHSNNQVANSDQRVTEDSSHISLVNADWVLLE